MAGSPGQRTFRTVLERTGLDPVLRQAWVELRRLGERAKFAWVPPPTANDAIVLAGSGRSGTTWIADVLGQLFRGRLQPIFEPLMPRWNSVIRNLTGWHAPEHFGSSYYLRPGDSHPRWRAHLESILQGRFRNYWTDHERVTYFPDRYLIKFIRANLMLGFLAKEFAPRIVYVVRDPCAVVASRIANGWPVCIRDYLEQPDLVADFLEPYTRRIAMEDSLVGRHAIAWSIENRVAQRDLGGLPHLTIDYDAVLDDRRQLLAQLSGFFRMDPASSECVLTDRPSRKAHRRLVRGSRNNSPKSNSCQLDREDQRRVLHWAEEFGVRTPPLDSHGGN